MRIRFPAVVALMATFLIWALAFPSGAHAETITGRFPQHDFHFHPRTLSNLDFPVPTLQPRQPGKVIALDLHPSPGAVESPGNGFSWVDSCDADVMHANDKPVRCARVSMQSIGAVFASYVANDGQPLPLFLQVNGFNYWAVNTAGVLYPPQDAARQIGSPSNRVIDAYFSGIASPVSGYQDVPTPSSLAQTIQQLKAQIVAMSGRMDRAGLAP